MAEEFTIKSETIESKINQLLPSQGWFGAGVDFSASTMVIPIVDLTETAEGSLLRQDLQTSFSFTSITNANIQNATNTTLVNTTGYYRVLARAINTNNGGTTELNLFDGSASKTIIKFCGVGFSGNTMAEGIVDFNVFIKAGESLRGTCASSNSTDYLNVTTRQIADLTGNLVNPT